MGDRHIPSLSLILLTHATPAHIAAFAHCCKHFPLFTQIPIYATTPVISLGRTLLQDIYASTPLASTLIARGSLVGPNKDNGATTTTAESDILLQAPTSDEIASYFNLINPLRYSQPHQPIPSPFSPQLNGLTITAYNAGHTLGGTIWHIQHGMESVVYAVDWNLTRENVISGASWLDGGGTEVIEQLRKPTALICSSRGIEGNTQIISRPKRDELLLDMVKNTLSKGGIVLIPSDSSARVLELSWVLENAWRKNQNDESIRKSQLILANRTAGSTMDFTRSMIEWMDENVTKAFEADTEKPKHRRTDSKRPDNKSDGDVPDLSSSGPFSFKHLKLVEGTRRLKKLLDKKEPMVIVASDISLGWGFSQQVLKHIAKDSNSLVILTDRVNGNDSKTSSSASMLWKLYENKKDVITERGKNQTFQLIPGGGGDLHIYDLSREPLDATELVTYQQYLAVQKQLQQVQNDGAAKLESAADVIEEASASSSSSEESDDEKQGKSLNFSSRILQSNKHRAADDKDTQGINALLRKPGFYDWDVRGKKGREAIFPFFNKRKRADEYGELIRPEDYLRAEEREEIEGRDVADNKDTGLGEKRKWGEVKTEAIHANGKKSKRKEYQDPSSEDESEDETIYNGPSKLITKTSLVQVNLSITFLDFSGIHDGRSLTMLIPLIRPRKVILTGGTESEIKKLADECRQRFKPSSSGGEGDGGGGGRGEDILTPRNGETVAASMDTNAWTVKLSRALVRRIQWQEVKGLEVVTLVGRLKATSMEEHDDDDKETIQRRKRQRTSLNPEVPSLSPLPDPDLTKEDLQLTLDILPANLLAATRTSTQPVHVGDLRLADLRKILQSAGHTADFRGEGILVVDNLVAVKKRANGQIEVECNGSNHPALQTRGGSGNAGRFVLRDSAFDVVKRRIYEGLAVIAG